MRAVVPLPRPHTASGQPVGKRQHHARERVWLGRSQVPVRRPAIQRALPHQEAKPQVLLHQNPAEPHYRGRRVPAAQHHLGGIRPTVVVAHEADPTLRSDLLGLRLLDVMKERREPQCLGGGHTVPNRLGQLRRDRLGVPRQVVPGVRRDVGSRVDNLQGVLEHVQVMKLALFDPAGHGQLRQHHVDQPEPVEQPQPLRRIIESEQPAHLHVHPLTRGVVRQAGPRLGPLGRVLVNLEIELVSEPGETQQPQRIVVKHALGDKPQNSGFEVGATAERIDQLAAVQRKCHRVDRKVALSHVLENRSAAAGDVNRGLVGADPPGTVPL